mgnify:CR=1 FL=1
MFKKKFIIRLSILLVCTLTGYIIETQKIEKKKIIFEISLNNNKIFNSPKQYNYKIDKYLNNIYLESLKLIKSKILSDLGTNSYIKHVRYNAIFNNEDVSFLFILRFDGSNAEIVNFIKNSININLEYGHEYVYQRINYELLNNEKLGFTSKEKVLTRQIVEQFIIQNKNLIIYKNQNISSNKNLILTIFLSIIFSIFVIYFLDSLLLKKFSINPKGRK